jgi:hypothetical protein
MSEATSGIKLAASPPLPDIASLIQATLADTNEVNADVC